MVAYNCGAGPVVGAQPLCIAHITYVSHKITTRQGTVHCTLQSLVCPVGLHVIFYSFLPTVKLNCVRLYVCMQVVVCKKPSL